MFAARSNHVGAVIVRAGARRLIVCDRFTDATYAYKGRHASRASAAQSSSVVTPVPTHLTIRFACRSPSRQRLRSTVGGAHADSSKRNSRNSSNAFATTI